MINPSRLPEVVVLGGGANALSIARSLGARGIRVYALNEPDALIRHSRFCRWLDVPIAGNSESVWARFLLSRDSEPLHGALLLAASDAALSLLAKNRTALARLYALDLSNPDAQLRMLDKLETYRIAEAAGVRCPRFWRPDSAGPLDALAVGLEFPLLVKPRLSHEFQARFGRKFFVARDAVELQSMFERAQQAGLEVVLMELVPGPDHLLCSYYTYLDEEGTPLFDFTKRVIRRYPIGMGGGTYHITDYVPEVRELALRVFRRAGLRGLANAEFKRDPRNGEYQMIECNARFTAANGLVAASGIDLAYLVYARVAGLALPRLQGYLDGVRLWDPIRDLHSYRQLREAGELDFMSWVKGLAHRQTFPHFDWRDPLPGLVSLQRELARMLKSRLCHARDGLRNGFRRLIEVFE